MTDSGGKASDKFAGLPNIPPDPKLQLTAWDDKGLGGIEKEYNAKVRRAFIQQLITEYPIHNLEEIQEAVRRRFGAATGMHTALEDLRELKVLRVPIPGGGTRYRIANQINTINVEQELDERMRIDTLSLSRKDHMIYLEVNRGTAMALVQLINLMVDDAQLPYVIGVTSDGDKWVVIHMQDAHRAHILEGKLKPKLY